jgi:hypothetical protein
MDLNDGTLVDLDFGGLGLWWSWTLVVLDFGGLGLAVVDMDFSGLTNYCFLETNTAQDRDAHWRVEQCGSWICRMS